MKSSLSLIALLSLVSCTVGSLEASQEGSFDRRALLAGEKRYLADQKCFGAPIPPWKAGAKPGWKYGKSCKGLSLPNWDGGDAAQCWWRGWNGGPVCRSGNPSFPLPSSCRPPLMWWPYPSKGKTSTTSKKPCTTSTTSSSMSVITTAPNPVTTPTTITTSTATSTSTGGALGPICTGTSNTYQVVFQNYMTVATSGVYTNQTVGAATQDDSYMTFGMVDTVDDCFSMCDSINGCSFINTYHDVEDDEPTGQHDPSKLKCVIFGKCVDPAISNNNWGGQNDPNYITNSNGYCRSGACPIPSS